MKLHHYLRFSLLIPLLKCESGSVAITPGEDALLAESKQQVLIVVNQPDNNKGRMFCYEQKMEQWHKIFSDVSVVIGRNGLSKQKERDQK